MFLSERVIFCTWYGLAHGMASTLGAYFPGNGLTNIYRDYNFKASQ